jgi:hypothetical protein
MKIKRSLRSLHLDFVPGCRWSPPYQYKHTEIWCPDGDMRAVALVYEYRLVWFSFTIMFDQVNHGA